MAGIIVTKQNLMAKLVSAFSILMLLIFIVGCGDSSTKSEVDAANVVTFVQDSESCFPGVTINKAIAGLLAVMQNKGSYIEIVGWSQDYTSGGKQDVWFKVKTDDELSTFHWVITPDGKLHAANALAQKVTKSPAN